MNNQVKILLAEEGSEFGRTCAASLSAYGCAVELISRDGVKVIEAIRQFAPDVVLMDSFMATVDALGVLHEVGNMGLKNKPIIIVISSVDNAMFEQQLLTAGADYYFLKPFDAELMTRRIIQFTGWESRKPVTIGMDPTGQNMAIVVSDIMRQIGIPAHIKGYQYIRSAIMYAVDEPSMLSSVTKVLYPQVAREYQTSPSRVERAIRHAIEVAWDRGNVETLESYFGYTIQNNRGKPTNSEFIAMISDKLRLNLKVS